MEDAHTTVLNLNKVGTELDYDVSESIYENNEETDKQLMDNQDLKSIKFTHETDANPNAFFAVFDGHGGDKIAKFSGNNVYKIIRLQDKFAQGDYSQAMKDGFLETDAAILKDQILKNDQSGCTATTTLINNNKIVCANSGDSRSILSINGVAKPLSYDHKPTNEGEKLRINKAGGFVELGRVNGNLALSRAIGDFDFKKNSDLSAEEQIVTVFPDIIEHELNFDNDEFVVLACDGIWDCLSSQQVVELVRGGIHKKMSLTEISEAIIDICLAPNTGGSGIGCDNMSIIIVALLGGRSLDEWYQSIINKTDTPFLTDFDKIHKEIFNSVDEVDEAGDAHGNSHADDDDNDDNSKQTFSIQQLLENNILTNKNGIFYLNAAAGGVPLNPAHDDNESQTKNENEEEEGTITEVDEEEK